MRIRPPWRLPRYPSPEPSRIRALTAQRLTAFGRSSPIWFTPEVADTIAASIGSVRAETGGMLGGRRGSGVVDHVFLDRHAEVTGSTYEPDIATVNRVLREQWNPAGIHLLGFVHSHPYGAWRPSAADAHYARQIMRFSQSTDRMMLPIVQSAADSSAGYRINGFSLARGQSQAPTSVPVLSAESGDTPCLEGDAAWARVTDAYDLELMARSRLVVVGCGGSVGFLEDMARAGVGEFVLIDPDVCDAPNAATQQVYLDELGTPKVTAVAQRLTRVSSHVRVWTVQARLEELSDQVMRRLTLAPLPDGVARRPQSVLLCAFTDNFPPQARLNRLALQLGVASIAGAVYHQGRGIELTFTAPGVTRACARCALAGRYRANQTSEPALVTSHGSPLWASSMLNAMKQPITLALLHRDSLRPQHPATIRYRALLDRIRDRNLVQVALDPDIATTLGLDPFTRRNPDWTRVAPVGQPVFLPQEPDDGSLHPQCPDCGGTGDLSDSEGRFRDTRLFPVGFGEHRWSQDNPTTREAASVN